MFANQFKKIIFKSYQTKSTLKIVLQIRHSARCEKLAINQNFEFRKLDRFDVTF